VVVVVARQGQMLEQAVMVAAVQEALEQEPLELQTLVVAVVVGIPLRAQAAPVS
jgi:hypothetical protein